MSKQYYSILPPEARLQLLIEADIGTVLQLCDDEPFKNICDGELLWEERLQREFGKTSTDPKEEYFKLSKGRLKKEIKDNKNKISDIYRDIDENYEILKLKEAEKKEIKKIKTKYMKQKDIIVDRIKSDHNLYETVRLLDQQELLLKQLGSDNIIYVIYPNISSSAISRMKQDFGRYGANKITNMRGRIKIEFDDPRDMKDALVGLSDEYHIATR